MISAVRSLTLKDMKSAQPQHSSQSSTSSGDSGISSAQSKRLLGLIALLVCLAGFLFFNPFSSRHFEREELIEQVDQRLSSTDFQGAFEYLLAAQQQASSKQQLLFDELWLQLGEQFQKREEYSLALQSYAQVQEESEDFLYRARLASCSIYLNEGELIEAEHQLKIPTKLHPTSEHVLNLKVGLLTSSGRRFESLPLLTKAIQKESGDLLHHLIYAGVPDELPAPDEAYFAKVYNVGDPLGLLCSSRIALGIGNYDQALELLNVSLEKRPELIESHVQHGRILMTKGDKKGFDQWVRHVPDEVQRHCDYWALLGQRCQELGQLKEAIRCYWEALNRQPNHNRASYQLGQLLSSVGEAEKAKAFVKRSGTLALLKVEITTIYDGHRQLERFMVCSRLCLDLGRLAEAAGWIKLTLMQDPNNQVAKALVRELFTVGTEPFVALVPEQDLAKQIPLADYPLPDFNTFSSPQIAETTPQTDPQALEEIQLQFTDLSEQMGIDFVYCNGEDLKTPGKRMFEYTGGGVGSCDYDLDGWPDLYFTQGSQWPPNPKQTQYLDALYRNRFGESAIEVSALSNIADAGFGQGLSFGDYNSDGFPDIYVANIFGNKLYLNNGDGTFDDVTTETGIGHRYWSTSCLMADMDLDGHPDLYDVTFLDDKEIFDRICEGVDGIPRSCAPQGFAAAPNIAYKSSGDGTFTQRPETAGLNAFDGDGLGVLLGRFDESQKLSMFIANDGRPNFFFVPQFDENVDSPSWQEEGSINGMAFDSEGKALACMGIAADDCNHDGLLDLYVTNFYLESNTFYQNVGGGTFFDQTENFQLKDPSWPKLGFGTQFLDANLDGSPDLIIANGHVDDFSYKGTPYQMEPQLMLSLNGEKFKELPAEQAGDFFSIKHLGRGLTTLDWNCDGKTDFAVSQLNTPSPLVINQSELSAGHLEFEFVCTQTARDAIGTVVEIETEGFKRTLQLTGGSGYHASNQKLVATGLGQTQGPFDVRITWPNGDIQEFDQVTPNHRYLAVEGHSALRPLSHKFQIH